MIDNTAMTEAERQQLIAWLENRAKCPMPASARMYQLAADAIRTQSNEPLTIDQLRGMNGEPVWCVDAKGRGIWALVHVRDEVCTDADLGDWEFYCYGWRDGDKLNENGWLAYKQKMEEHA